jgi:hypothetical protein
MPSGAKNTTLKENTLVTSGNAMKRISAFILIIFMLCSLASCDLFEHKHTLERVEAKPSTCTERGNGEYYRCTGCDKLFSDPSGEQETYAEYVMLELAKHALGKATCSSPATCSVCGATEGDALGHLFDGDCDSGCNRQGCGETREAESHLDKNEDGICDVCGAEAAADVELGEGEGEFLPPDEFD